jgi:hypothetical protein
MTGLHLNIGQNRGGQALTTSDERVGGSPISRPKGGWGGGYPFLMRRKKGVEAEASLLVVGELGVAHIAQVQTDKKATRKEPRKRVQSEDVDRALEG